MSHDVVIFVRDTIIRFFVLSAVVLVAPLIFVAHYLFGDVGGRDGIGSWLSLGPDIYWSLFRMSWLGPALSATAVMLVMLGTARLLMAASRAANATVEGRRASARAALVFWLLIILTYGSSGYLSYRKARMQNNEDVDWVEVELRKDGSFPTATDVQWDDHAWTFNVGPLIPVSSAKRYWCKTRDFASGQVWAQAPRNMGPAAISKCATDKDGVNLLVSADDADVLIPKAVVMVSVRDAWD